MKNAELKKKALDFLSSMYDEAEKTGCAPVERIIVQAAKDIDTDKQSVQFLMNKYYNSIYRLSLREKLDLPEKFSALLNEAQKLCFKNGLFYGGTSLGMALYE